VRQACERGRSRVAALPLPFVARPLTSLEFGIAIMHAQVLNLPKFIRWQRRTTAWNLPGLALLQLVEQTNPASPFRKRSRHRSGFRIEMQPFSQFVRDTGDVILNAMKAPADYDCVT
jgi:hypothetical protein